MPICDFCEVCCGNEINAKWNVKFADFIDCGGAMVKDVNVCEECYDGDWGIIDGIAKTTSIVAKVALK
jgi:hypothetical protein